MMPTLWYPNAGIKYLERILRPLDDRLITVSEGVQRAFNGSSQHGWQTIHNGIDVQEYRRQVNTASSPAIDGLAEGGLNFLNIGRFVPEKSQSDLILAMDSVVEALPSANLIIVGGGQLKDELQNLIDDLGLYDNVFLIDHVSSVFGYYALADVFVFSSIDEGLPLVTLEAMAAKLPVIATDIPGVNEVVIDEKTGYLIPPNRPDLLAENMLKLRDVEIRNRFAKNAFEIVSNQFDISTTVSSYNQVYYSLFSSG